MRLRIRLLWLILCGFFQNRLTILDTSTVHLRVLFNDTDIRKVSGDRYFALGDLGWGSLYIRWGAFNRVLKGECAPVGQVMTLNAREPLWLMQKFKIETKVLWWDQRWLYFEQRYIHQGKVKVVGVGKGGLLKGGVLMDIVDWVPGAETSKKPEKPEQVVAIQNLENSIQW
ncbi:MAG: hypothetical protein ACI9XU_000935 [Arenicella sp.]|jgi:hypothetical protein